MITIYKKGTNEVRAVVDPDDSSKQERALMGSDIVTLTFKSVAPIAFAIGDYATIFGALYQVNRPVPFKKIATRNISYTLTLEGLQYQLNKTAYLFLDANNHFTEGKFSLRGRPLDFMNLVIHNMNRMYPGEGWTLGDVVTGDYVTLDFDSQKCIEVLSTLASQFKTEYLVEGKTVSLTKKQLVSGITLEYGQGKALTSIAMQNQDSNSNSGIITRLYAYGSERNIGANYRDGAKYLRMADSLYIERNADVLGVFEAFIYFDDIYPRREGTISAVGTNLVFTDDVIEFNVNDYLIAGVTAQVTFNTGLLTGYTFDVHEFDNDTKTFTINTLTSETVALPTDVLKPAIGDKYVLINIVMPLSYIEHAEAELKQRAITYLKENGPGNVAYPVDCNNLYFQKTGIELQLGKTYRLLSADFAIDRQIRLVSYTRNIRRPFMYTTELADAVAAQSTIIKLFNLI